MMGCYINPTDCSKETWLINNGVRTTEAEVRQLRPETGMIPVCWVDNGEFTAVGIGYCQMEIDAFLHPDPRPKIWYLVEKSKLIEFCPSLGSETYND